MANIAQHPFVIGNVAVSNLPANNVSARNIA